MDFTNRTVKLWEDTRGMGPGQLSVVAKVNDGELFNGHEQGLHEQDFLALPNTLQVHSIEAVDVGCKHAYKYMSNLILAQIYLLNKARAPAGVDAVRYGFLRLEAVKAGWIVPCHQPEVVYLPAPEISDAIDTFMDDLMQHSEEVGRAREASFMVPIAAEHIFRELGQSYNEAQAEAFGAAYQDFFDRCRMPDITSFLPPKILYHTALHWVGHARAWTVMQAQKDSVVVPQTIRNPVKTVPARYKLIPDVASRLTRLRNDDQLYQLLDSRGFNRDLIQTIAKKMTADPRWFHHRPDIYGLVPLSPEDFDRVEEARRMAINFLILIHGFRDRGTRPSTEQPLPIRIRNAGQTPARPMRQ